MVGDTSERREEFGKKVQTPLVMRLAVALVRADAGNEEECVRFKVE